ncbi:MAG TPA: FG-GAP-like repeat-containing protein [Micromonosporaceae bacterium]|nr:FG-GAP-like repeat-containing protein [Micromonosporaceae bacterium]
MVKRQALSIALVLITAAGVGATGQRQSPAAERPAFASVEAAATTTVRTRDELLAALANAVAGDTVFVESSASINLTGHKRIPVPAGVTLASDRGLNGSLGALLYNTELDLGDSEGAWAQFSPRGSGVRITGLRLRGPDTEIRNSAYEYDNSRGIEAVGISDLLVDNNELYGWSHAAVFLVDTLEARVRGNAIHHNRRTGLGYGVALHNNSSAVIEDNVFTQNRHAIAGSGLRTQRYEARFNLVVDNALSHGFDMHGENEALGNGSPYAGDVIHIRSNSFRSSAQPAVVIRGRPATRAWVSSNCFAHSSTSTAVVQKNFTGNLTIGANTYSTRTGLCHQSGRRVAWRLSASGTGNWAPLAPYTFDVSEVGFGDFDGDSRTDVFRTTGARWYYSPGGQGPFVAGALSTTPRSLLRFGDFDGDRRTDVFTTSGGRWYYSSAAMTSWQPLALSNTPIGQLRFGDFDGDGRTDVFTSINGRWYYSPGGAANWQPLATSNDPLDGLRFGDFDGDGRTDVFQSNGGRWYYSSAGRTSWIPLALSGCPIASLHVDDFTGDGRADVFDGRCGG